MTEGKGIFMSKELKEYSESLLDDFISGLLGNPVALSRAMKTIISSPFFIREHLFWQKFDKFLRGLDFYLGDKIKFAERISRDGKENENAERIIHVIDSIDVDEKVKYIINVSCALCAEQIELDQYFRLMQAIKDNLIEDLIYLKNNIRRKEIKYDINIFALSQKGLAYQSLIGEGGVYSFTDLGICVVLFAIERNKMEFNKDLLSKIGLPFVVSTGIEYLSTDEMDDMLNNVFNSPYTYNISPDEWIKEKDSWSFTISVETHKKGVSPSIKTSIKETNGTYSECGCHIATNNNGDVIINIGGKINEIVRVVIK
jgi:hypothetical protein